MINFFKELLKEIVLGCTTKYEKEKENSIDKTNSSIYNMHVNISQLILKSWFHERYLWSQKKKKIAARNLKREEWSSMHRRLQSLALWLPK